MSILVRGSSLLLVLISFIAFSQGIEFQCKFQIYGDLYTCYEAQVTDNSNSTSLESVQGNHMSGKTNSDVKGLFVRYAKTVERWPKNIDTFFPDLEYILWQSGILSAITADDLRQHPELRTLTLYSNYIVSLNADLFQHTPKISYIVFSNNLIMNVGTDLLSNLTELGKAGFGFNPCISFNADSPLQLAELKERLCS